MKLSKLGKSLALAAVCMGFTSQAFAEDRSYILATASTGGTYYPVGVALATLSKVKLAPKYKFSLSAISSAGSGENVKLLNENEAQFAILQGLYGAWAWNGEGPYKARQDDLRSVSMLWQNVEHFIVRSDLASSGTVSDLDNLKDKKFSIGKKNSGTENSGRQIMKGLGVDADSFNLAHMG
ncbi:MAG TPA: C4-dicarboxylate ABC transporter substrate-binding protein, partial [Vibrio sp.]|nr:C4-dicarboxylate ABC transporter substrate-binding protein [Vibrio sp.]